MYETERLLLRPVNAEVDCSISFQAESDPECMALMSPGPPMPPSREAVMEFLRPKAPPTLPRFAICENTEASRGWPRSYEASADVFASTPPAIGFVIFQDRAFNFQTRIAYIGLCLVKEQHRGKGYGTEVLRWALEYAFMDLGLHRVALEVYSYNQPALNLYRKIGFVEEGRLRRTILRKNQWHDTMVMAVLEEEWFEIRKSIVNGA